MLLDICLQLVNPLSTLIFVKYSVTGTDAVMAFVSTSAKYSHLRI